MIFHIEIEQEADGRWIAEVEALPGVQSYGTTRTDAVAKIQALALRLLAERLEHGEAVAELLDVSFQAGDNTGYKNFFIADAEHEKAMVVFTNGDKGARLYERVIRGITGEDQPGFLWT